MVTIYCRLDGRFLKCSVESAETVPASVAPASVPVSSLRTPGRDAGSLPAPVAPASVPVFFGSPPTPFWAREKEALTPTLSQRARE